MNNPLAPVVDPKVAALLGSYAKDAPTDSDCLAVSRVVTAALLEHGLAASTATVAGWADPGATIVRFFHQVTLWEGFVFDGTARQFSTARPAAWIAPVEIFLHDLAQAAHADHASFFPPPSPSHDS
ncbi:MULTISPECIES: hypothetical protein [Nocardia]|uniref:hypothetical protein n=1 Tax=Nocardia TaxID=1817 RepID=UPI002456EE98|nr:MULTISPECIES: hypothetical protein [Nocardia]